MYLIALFVLAAFILKQFLKPHNPPIFGVYQQGTIWTPLKYAAMYLVLQFRALSQKRSEDDESDPLYASEEDRATEGVQPHTDHPLAIDAVYFNASSANGGYLICGVARRPKGICNAFLYFKAEGGELMLSPELPNTTIVQKADEINKFHVGGIKIDVIIPMREWRIRYDGPMKYHSNPEQTVHVNFDLMFKANYKRVNFDTDMSIPCLADMMSKEVWSREYFDRLKSTHQTHFEQMGRIVGRAKIGDVVRDIKLDSMRDHTFGEYRDWRELHRYAFHFINLPNGDQIHVGRICFPTLFSNITCGYICKNSDKKVYPVEHCTFELHEHGENGRAPVDYAFQFRAGGKIYTVQVDVKDSTSFYIGEDRDAVVTEHFVAYTVDGVEGWGTSEWQYKNRDKDLSQKKVQA